MVQLNNVFMKPLFVLLITAVSLFSCSKENEQDPVADYKVLGVTSVTINGQEFNVKDGVLLDVAGTSSIAADGMLIQSMHTEVSYVVLTSGEITPSVDVKSSCADVSVNIMEETFSGRPSYTVLITRKGYQEQLTYVFRFIGFD
jgi:hypothetical protein